MSKAATKINPSYPMAQFIENTSHDKQKYPFAPEYPKINKKPRCFKIILNSTDRINGLSSPTKFTLTTPVLDAPLGYDGMKFFKHTFSLSFLNISGATSILNVALALVPDILS